MMLAYEGDESGFEGGESSTETDSGDSSFDALEGDMESAVEVREDTENSVTENLEGNLDEAAALRNENNMPPENTENSSHENTESNHYKNCPVNNGKWENPDGSEGKRGESKWIPEREYVPQKANPDGKTWGQIMDENGIDGIEFKNGEPDFSEISKANIEIENFTSSRTDNFDQADMKLAEKWDCDPDEVAKWRSDNHYTWHECCDMKTMQLVPSEIHNNVTHRGGISNAKGV